MIGFIKQDTSKSMAQRLKILGLSYTYLAEQYESAKSPEDFVKWLNSVGVNIRHGMKKFVLILKSIRSKYYVYGRS